MKVNYYIKIKYLLGVNLQHIRAKYISAASKYRTRAPPSGPPELPLSPPLPSGPKEPTLHFPPLSYPTKVPPPSLPHQRLLPCPTPLKPKLPLMFHQSPPLPPSLRPHQSPRYHQTGHSPGNVNTKPHKQGVDIISSLRGSFDCPCRRVTLMVPI